MVRTADLRPVRPRAGFRGNICAYDLDIGASTQVTHFADFDVDTPSLGGRTITFQQGGRPYATDLPSGTPREIRVQVPDDARRTAARMQAVGVAARAADPLAGGDTPGAPARGGRRLSAHGDLFGVPVHGRARNRTGTPGADEDHPS